MTLKNLNPGVNSSDDGTNISLTVGVSTILKYRKSDAQILLDAGVDSDDY